MTFAILELVTENPWPLFLLLALAELLLLVAIRIHGQGVLLKLAVAVPIAAAGLFVLEWLIVTEREEVHADLRAAAQELTDGEAEKVLAHFSPTYDWQGANYETIKGWAHRFTGQYKLTGVSISPKKTEIKGGRATVLFLALASGQYTPNAYEFTYYPTKWQVEYRREGQDRQWKIYKVIPVSVPGLDISKLPDLVKNIGQSLF